MNEAPAAHKAAVLLSGLDEGAAEALLAHLSAPAAEALREQVVKLDGVSADEKQAVIEEFLSASPFAASRRAFFKSRGQAVEARISARAESAAAAAGEELDAVETIRPFAFLDETDDALLVEKLADEPPHATAIVVSHLPPSRAGNVVAAFPPQRQAEVLEQVARLENIDEEALRDAEQLLSDRLATAAAATPKGGVATVEEILRSTDEFVRQALRANLAQHAPELARRCNATAAIPSAASAEPSFEDVLRLSEERLARLFSEADPDVAILALAGGPGSLADRVAEQLPTREARLLQRAVGNLGPVRLSDIDAARHQLARLAAEMFQSATIPAPRSWTVTV